MTPSAFRTTLASALTSALFRCIQQIKMLHLPSLPTYSQVKPIVKDVIKGVNALCPNPNVSVTLPNKITFGCR